YAIDVGYRELTAAAHIVEGTFLWIGAGVGRAVTWLRWAFDWPDAWDTATALQSGLRQLPAVFAKASDHLLVDVVEGWFTEQEAHVRRLFVEAKARVSGRTFSSFDGLGDVPPEHRAAVPRVLNEGLPPHADWLNRQLRSASDEVARLTVPAGGL